MCMCNFACKGRPGSDLYCVGQDLTPYLLTHLCIRPKKFGELWSINHRDLAVKSYSPKSTLPPNVLHMLDNDQVLLVHPPLESSHD